MSFTKNPLLNNLKEFDADTSSFNSFEPNTLDTLINVHSTDAIYSPLPQPLNLKSDRDNASKHSKLFAHKKFQLCVCCLVIILVLCLPLAYLVGNIPLHCRYCEHTGSSTSPSSGTKITLLGDSLMTNPFHQFKFADQIRSKIPYLKTHVNQSIIFVDEGVGSDTIAKIANRIDSALSHNSEGLLLFWDTDCSDFSEKELSSQQVSDMRNKYENNLRYVLDKIVAAKTTVLGLAGPGLLGENAMLQSPFHSGFWSKEGMLDDYREINKKVCVDYNIKYIDVRSALQQAIPSDWPWSFGAVTVDGEHLNSRGVEIVAQLFANVIDDWLILIHNTTAISR